MNMIHCFNVKDGYNVGNLTQEIGKNLHEDDIVNTMLDRNQD